MKGKLIFIFVAGTLLLLGKFFILPNLPIGTPPELPDGNYEILYGTWQSDKTDAKGGLKIMLQISGENLSGELKVTNSPITKGGEIAGLLKGDKLEFGFVKDRWGLLKYTGTFRKGSMQGEWEIPLIKDHGTWQAAKRS